MYWNIYQQSQIHRNASKAGEAKNKADAVVEHLRQMEEKVEGLALACQSMWELVQEHSNITEKDLMQKMEEVDLRDGRADGRMSPIASPCEKCGRKTSLRRRNCLYCGHENQGGEVFGRK